MIKLLKISQKNPQIKGFITGVKLILLGLLLTTLTSCEKSEIMAKERTIIVSMSQSVSPPDLGAHCSADIVLDRLNRCTIKRMVAHTTIESYGDNSGVVKSIDSWIRIPSRFYTPNQGVVTDGGSNTEIIPLVNAQEVNCSIDIAANTSITIDNIVTLVALATSDIDYNTAIIITYESLQ